MAKRTKLSRPLRAQDLWARVGEQESGTVELKQQLPRPSRLQEPLVAFANSRGGTVVVGVTDRRPRSVIGVADHQELEEDVQSAARETHPPLHVTVEWLQVGGVDVALLKVDVLPEGFAQTSDGRLLVRAGPTNRVLVGQELLRFARERATEPAEDEPVARATLNDLDQHALREFLRARLGRTRFTLAGAARDVGLTDSEGRIRLATLLLFGAEPQSFQRRFGIVVSRFEGAVAGNPRLRDRQELKGPLPALVQQADRTVYAEMRRDAVVRGLIREEVPEYPPVALREALVNAVGHRNYALPGATGEVRLYDDAIEVESPGTLPGLVTVENLKDEQCSRNPRIMDALQRLGFVEEAGQGIDRMIAEMEEALLEPPEFEERSTSFVVRLRGGSIFAAEDRLWVGRFAPLSLTPHARVALVYARRSGSITNEELRSLRPIDGATARSVLQDLVGRGLLASTGRGRGTIYHLTDRALENAAGASLDEQLRMVLSHARRAGAVANREVRGLLNVDENRARSILTELVLRGLLTTEGERRGRRYLPTRRDGLDE